MSNANHAPHNNNGSSNGAYTASARTGRDFVGFFFKHFKLILGVWICVVGLTALLAYLIPLSYGAKATVLVERGKSPTLRSDHLRTPLESFEIISSEIQIVSSRTVSEEVVDRLELGTPSTNPSQMRRIRERIELALEDWGLLPRLSPREKAIKSLQQNLLIKQPAQSLMLDISYYHEDPKTAATIVDTLTQVYIERHRQIFADNTAAFFEQQLADIQEKLGAVRLNLERESDIKKISKLELDIQILESSYMFNHEKLDAAKADAAADESLANVRIVDRAKVSKRPRFSRLFIILISILAGLVLGNCLALIREYFDHRVYTPRDLAGMNNLAVLGTIRKSRAINRYWKIHDQIR